MVGALNPALDGFEASCFDGVYITGDITAADFDGWVEQRGSKFFSTWDKAYTPMIATFDKGQAPQQGGWLTASVGKGTWTYFAYALHRQFPIIPCSLCGNQENLQRVQIKAMIREWEKQYPGRTDNMFNAMGHITLSHMTDRALFPFETIRATGQPDPQGDKAFDEDDDCASPVNAAAPQVVRWG